MADGPAYTTVPGKLSDLLKKIRDVGVPNKATASWIESLGFKSSNDRSMLPVLRQIGFIDASGAPTPAWKEYRGAKYKEVLGRAVQLGYQDLYATYGDAHTRPNGDLVHVFSTRTSAGKQTVDKMVATFKNLASQAEFESPIIATPYIDEVQHDDLSSDTAAPTVVAQSTNTPAGMTVNINVQLTLPETKDETVYQAFFRAMRENLLSDGT